MEATNSSHDNSDDQRRTSRVYTVFYMGGGRYALDQLNAGTAARRVRSTRSLRAIQAELNRIQQPGDVVIMSEALRAMQLLELPCRRLSRMQSARGQQDLFDIHGEVGIIPLRGDAEEPVRGSVQVNHPRQGSPSPNRIKDILGGDDDAARGDGGPCNN